MKPHSTDRHEMDRLEIFGSCMMTHVELEPGESQQFNLVDRPRFFTGMSIMSTKKFMKCSRILKMSDEGKSLTLLLFHHCEVLFSAIDSA